jgi:hypothetical protein
MIDNYIWDEVNQIGKVEDYYLLSNSNNSVYLLRIGEKKFVLKIIKDTTTDYLLEKNIFEALQYKKYIITREDFLVYEYLEGRPIAEVDTRTIDCEKIIGQLFSFVDDIKRVSSTGCGKLDSDFCGRYESWQVFLFNYMENQFQKGKKVPVHIREKVAEIMKKHDVALPTSQLVTIPIDLNLKNFILDSNSKLWPINIPLVWRGDELAAIGEMGGHIFMTDYWKYFVDEVERRGLDISRIHYYMLLMAFVVLVFISNQSGREICKAKPWGNTQATFLDIIEYCNNKLKQKDERLYKL